MIKGYIDKKGNHIELTDYNRHAQQAYRTGIATEPYLNKLGYTKVWGRGRPSLTSDLQIMDTLRS